jgi:hypothetical protein
MQIHFFYDLIARDYIINVITLVIFKEHTARIIFVFSREFHPYVSLLEVDRSKKSIV